MKTFIEAFPDAEKGDEFKVTAQKSDHGFDVGETVLFRYVCGGGMYAFFENSERGAFLGYDEVELVKPEPQFEYLEEIDFVGGVDFNHTVKVKLLVDRERYNLKHGARFVGLDNKGRVLYSNDARKPSKTEMATVTISGKSFEVEVEVGSDLHEQLMAGVGS